MNVQYISVSEGQTTKIFIPIKDWNDLKNKYIDIKMKISIFQNGTKIL